MDRPHFELVSRINKRIAVPVTGAMPKHLQRFIHADNDSITDTAREPLHFHFDIANRDVFR